MQPNSDQRGLKVPSSRGAIAPHNGRQQATDLMRQQIEQIYEDDQPNEQVAAQPTVEAENPYEQTHDDQADIAAEEQNAAIQAHWQKYHSAWQQYYQMYYERYYQAQVQKQALSTAVKELDKETPKSKKEPEVLSEKQAVSELRSQLLEKVRTQTKKIRKSRHFMPAVVAIVVGLGFIFLQYNQIIVANVMAYTTPAATDSINNYIDPSTDVSVGPEPLLKIPKIGVEAPVIYGIQSLDENVVEQKLQNGVVHYPIQGANAVPGEIGNTVILGHSANDVFTPGNYKFIFLRLDMLQKGDTFYLNYQSKRYTYVVTEKKTIHPDQLSALVLNNGKPMATLVTCTPVGTSQDRLLVIGEQIAPDPAKAVASTQAQPSTSSTQQIGGGTQSFLERLFSGN